MFLHFRGRIPARLEGQIGKVRATGGKESETNQTNQVVVQARSEALIKHRGNEENKLNKNYEVMAEHMITQCAKCRYS